jgi:DNA adenine methylase
MVCDFTDAVADGRPGDLIYFDPPYTVAHNNNGFVRYNHRLFSWVDQERLARTAVTLASIVQ